MLKPGRWRWKSQDWKKAHGEFESEHQLRRPRQLAAGMCGLAVL